MKKFIGFIKKHPILIPILIFIVLRIPSLFEGYWYGDEGIYASVAQGMHQGKLIFNDIWDHKPPLIEWIYFLESFRGWEMGLFLVKLTSIVFGVFSLVYLGKISTELSKKKSFTFWVLIFASFFLGSPIIESNIAGGEVFFILFNIALFYYLLKEKKPILIGVLLFLTFLIKPQSFIEAGFMVFCWLIIKLASKKKFIPFLLKLLAGFFIPLIIYIIVLILQNNIGGFIDAVFIQNFAYSGDYETTVNLLGLAISTKIFKILLVVAIFALSLILFKKKKLKYSTFLLLNLFSIELFMVVFSGRSYAHYLIQLVPSISIFFGYAITVKINSNITIYRLMSLLGIIFISTVFFIIPFRYYSSFVKYISTTDKSKFSDEIEIWQDTGISKRINDFTKYFNYKYKDIKSCYIYTESAWAVALTDLPFTNKYVVWFHLGFSDIRMKEAISQFNNSEMFVVDNKAPVKYDEFFKNLSDFKLVDEKNDFLIYQRIVK